MFAAKAAPANQNSPEEMTLEGIARDPWTAVDLPLPQTARDFLTELKSIAIRRLSEKDCYYPRQFQFHGETLWAFPNQDIGNGTDLNIDILDSMGPAGRVLSTFVVKNAEVMDCGSR